MQTQLILDFLQDLQNNNNLAWMQEHKARYQEAKALFEELLGELIERLAEFDPGIACLKAKDLVFRLNRDTRFSYDKSPYRPAFRAHISPAKRHPIPVGYYLNIQPGSSFLGGGLFADQFQAATQMVRQTLLHDSGEFSQIIQAPQFAARFTITGTKLKNVPAGYPKEHPLAEYLKHKAWALEYPLTDAQFANKASFIALAIETYSLMLPFNAYLNQALQSFALPSRDNCSRYAQKNT